MIKKPEINRIDQGLIFDGCIAEAYSNCDVLGIIITARCDLAHNKAPVYNYLPIVQFNDWLSHDGFDLLQKQATIEAFNKIKSFLTEQRHSPAIVDSISPRVVLDTLFPVPVAPAPSSAHNQFKTLVDKYESVQNSTKGNASLLYKDYSKLAQSIIKSCVKQLTNGYYFLPKVKPSESDPGYVVLLRQVKSLPAILGRSIPEGIDAEKYESICKVDQNLYGHLSFQHRELIQPVGQLISPNIEHLLQCFCSLFSRIGLTDIDEPLLSRFCLQVPN